MVRLSAPHAVGCLSECDRPLRTERAPSGPAECRELDRELGAVALIEAVVRGDVPRRVLVGDGMSRPRRPSRRAYLCNGADLPIASGFPFSGKPEANGAQRRLLVSLSTRPPEIAADGSVDAIVS